MTLPPRNIWLLAIAISLAITGTLRAVTMEELRNVKKMTPQKFASYFSKFEYKFRAEVQAPEVFLATKSGDCDDFAVLADEILSAHGYTTRLISVRMPSGVHVVCYVEETRCILDYNNRRSWRKTVRAEDSISAIADKVSRTFGQSWRSASEFTYDGTVKRLVRTELDEKAQSIQLTQMK